MCFAASRSRITVDVPEWMNVEYVDVYSNLPATTPIEPMMLRQAQPEAFDGELTDEDVGKFIEAHGHDHGHTHGGHGHTH